MVRRERNIRRRLFTSSIKCEISHFQVVVRTVRAQKCTKSVMHCCANLNLSCFFLFFCCCFFDVVVAKALFYLKRCKFLKNTLCDWLNRVYYRTLTQPQVMGSELQPYSVECGPHYGTLYIFLPTTFYFSEGVDKAAKPFTFLNTSLYS